MRVASLPLLCALVTLCTLESVAEAKMGWSLHYTNNPVLKHILQDREPNHVDPETGEEFYYECVRYKDDLVGDFCAGTYRVYSLVSLVVSRKGE